MNTRVWSVRLSVMAVVAAFLSLGVLPSDAEAKRMGSGGSFGRSAPSQFQKSPPASPSGAASTAPSKQQATNGTAAGNTAAAAPRNRFLGPLAGLAAGLGLAALFSHLGMGAGLAEFMGTLLMVGALVFAVVFLVRMLRGQKGNKPQPAYNAQGASGSAYGNNSSNNSYRQSPEAPRYTAPASVTGNTSPINDPVPGMGAPRSDQGFGQFGNSSAFDAPLPAATPVKDLPHGFDEANFVNSAKKFFVTMQGVFDQGDVAGLREYCSDEVVDHLRAEIESRGNAVNRTDVVTLNAQLIGFETDVDEQIATVAFTGLLREEQDADATEINELWIMSRPVSGGGWVLSGIHNL
ncbi:putative lipid-binding transport protein (Tim44 family) [Limnobacter thiooxidans]|uniref:TIM44-like domain-containing protein n=1 Tax=Limnobacter thiooxidans TaxID=131080 RepID=A0AA86IZX1_9BURK|nr:putative lipid-binding transport protein (Tim44 family) [Limnobacter thiooxidans]BET26897.1 TIM44-like domain-containing protein [Limnobacter thiooxidans]